MRAITINEIKRMGTRGTLASVGVGKVQELVAANKIKEYWPQLYRSLEPVYRAEKLNTASVKELLKRIELKLNINLDNFLWIDFYSQVSGNSDIEKWFIDLKLNKVEWLIPRSETDRGLQKTAVFKYNDSMHIGELYVDEGEYGMVLLGFLVEYK